MIIGNNNGNMNNQNFLNKMNEIKENANNIPNWNNNQPVNTMQHANVLSKKDMNERSFQMLQDRLNKGLITLDEFNKKCKDLTKR